MIGVGCSSPIRRHARIIMSAAAKSIAIFGGAGFLGRKICENGIALGYSVISFTRLGSPPANLAKEPWVSKVNWQKGNIFEPETYKAQLRQVDAVVHSIGMLFENTNYKKTLNSNVNFLNDVQNLANSLKGSNPMQRNSFNTYGAVQRDSAVLLADEFVKQFKSAHENSTDKPAFVYISADKNPPIVPKEYITTKREAEFELMSKPDLRTIVLRPGIMYDAKAASLTPRGILTLMTQLGHATKQVVVGDQVSFLNDLVRPPVSTDKVAFTLYDLLEDKLFSGICTLDEMAL